jgi:putative FmdB family regulatory protein
MIYDYKCKSCGYEEKDKYSLKPLEGMLVCPKCKKKALERQLTRASFVLKWNEKQ